MSYKTTEYFSLTKETIEREATADEIAQIQASVAKAKSRQAEAQAKATAKAALLDRLGITADEAKLLLS